MTDRLWVEPVGNIIVARVRGEPTIEVLRECQERVLRLVRQTGRGRVLYDTLEMDAPPVDIPWAQRDLDAEVATSIRLRRAIVVPNSKLAYLARLAFGDADYRVFYNDIVEAVTWLDQDVEEDRRIAGAD